MRPRFSSHVPADGSVVGGCGYLVRLDGREVARCRACHLLQSSVKIPQSPARQGAQNRHLRPAPSMTSRPSARRIGVRGSMAVHRLANTVTFGNNYGVSFVAASGQNRFGRPTAGAVINEPGAEDPGCVG